MVVSVRLDVTPRDLSAKRQEEYVGQVATHCYSERWDEEINELEVEGQADDQVDEYAYESEEEDMVMYEDEETNPIMESVFGDYDEDNTI